MLYVHTKPLPTPLFTPGITFLLTISPPVHPHSTKLTVPPSNLTRTADYLSAALVKLGFILLSKTGGQGLPLVAVRLDPKAGHLYDEFAIAHHLRERGWVVPAYTMGTSFTSSVPSTHL
jgi:hypothetical protein